VLVDLGTLLPAHLVGVALGKPPDCILDGDPHGRAGLLALAPVEHEFLPGEGGQELAGDTLGLAFLLPGQVGAGTGEDVEDGESRLGEVLGDVALLFFVEPLGKIDQVIEEDLDVAGAGVVFSDLKL